MNSLSEVRGASQDGAFPAGMGGAEEGEFELLEFRLLSDADVARMDGAGEEFAGRKAAESGGLRGTAGLHDAAVREAAEAARREGFQAGEREGQRLVRESMDAELKARVDRERERLLTAVHEFGEARRRYFGDVEQEVVKLALAIAARVLHREAQVDPLLLSAAVRMALEKMADRSGVVLRAAEGEAAGWEKMFHAMEATERPRVVCDAALGRGDCVLETKVGTVELGVRIQLEEIEKGFFDLLNHRPGQ